MGRALLSILLQEPVNAYASPTRALKDKKNYDAIFKEDHSRDIYVVCILIQRQVDKYLASQAGELRTLRSILRYYASMAVACVLLGTAARPSANELVKLLPTVVKPLDGNMLADCCNMSLTSYKKRGGTEKIAKGPEMLEELRSMLGNKLAVTKELKLEHG